MKLSDRRLKAGLQQKDLMRDISLYSKIENGKAIAIPEDCESFAKIFGCKVEELFEEKELLFFERLLSLDNTDLNLYKEFAEKEAKIASNPICKPSRRHIELVRKCYRLNKTRNEELKRKIHEQGFRTEQDWYNFIVDREIEKEG